MAFDLSKSAEVKEATAGHTVHVLSQPYLFSLFTVYSLYSVVIFIARPPAVQFVPRVRMSSLA